ncbi:bacterioferritin [Motiliproteus coralliicola]|uniref:Bacterioferritin n=1 Tax=Motiliproteus coralliicola TaxID=2283196 RepID=A0A369WKX0_9GAMM|nr:bacterioferritin [Motiliproteus coralliicola]RDE22718.1 bacterioferritin [Motiliproteus coralliicola]
MKGNQKIIDQLNRLLASELTAMDQYFIHSEMYRDWGLNELYERIAHEFEDEKGHASKLIERILFLEGTPNMVNRDPLRVGKDVPEMLNNDLLVEYEVGDELKKAIALCEAESDYQSREILEGLLADTEEDHTFWLEQQLGLIKKIGIQNYLQSKM